MCHIFWGAGAGARAAPQPASQRAGAGTTWAVQATPDPIGPTGELVSDYCTTSKSCIAVGDFLGANGTEFPLAELRDGSSWVIHSPVVHGARASILSGVECTSAIACMAVGSAFSPTGEQSTLAVLWNGTDWTELATPEPTGAQAASLSGVSCSSSSACIAVGSYTDGRGVVQVLAFYWNGSSWSLVATPAPAGAESSVLTGVGCSRGAGAACVAVGDYINGSGTEEALAEVWDGSGWSLSEPPNPAGASESLLAAASCPAATSCTAVGRSSDGVLIETYSRSGWVLVPTSTSANFLDAVDCSAASSCTAVGGQVDRSGVETTLVLRGGGSTWEPVSSADEAGAAAQSLSGLSCQGPSQCLATGSFTSAGGDMSSLAETWDGRSWSLSPALSASRPEAGTLASVSCVRASSCISVGEYQQGSGTQYPMVQSDSAGTWTLGHLPVPAGATGATVASVSCSAVGACTAVGSSSKGPWLERMSGDTWSIQKSVVVSGSMTSVSCPTISLCMAVGATFQRAGKQIPLAELWRGSSWSKLSPPVPAGAVASSLQGVSCAVSALCLAVGTYTSSSEEVFPMVEMWNGRGWSRATVAQPSGATSSALESISCPVPGWCAAVGYYTQSNGTLMPLAEGWTGGRWFVRSSIEPGGASSSQLSAVSCASKSSCMAVGRYADASSAAEPLAETFDGTDWALDIPEVDPFSGESGMQSVSCPSTSACVAVGSSLSAGAPTKTLAELSLVKVPTVTTNPAPAVVAVGSRVTFAAAATSNPPPNVIWQASSNGGKTWLAIPKAQGAAYSMKAVKADDGRLYRAEFYDMAGASTTSAARLTIGTPVRITRQPVSVSVRSGTPVAFTVAASGSPQPTLLWQMSTDGGRTWDTMPKATTDTYRTRAVAADNGRLYRVVAWNRAGGVVSSAAKLTVT